MQRNLLVILGIVAAASATFALYQRREVMERNAIIEDLRKELRATDAEPASTDAKAKLEAELATARADIARLKDERDAARKAAREPARIAEAPANPAAPAPATETAKNPMQGFAEMFKTEEGRKMLKAQVSMMTKMQYSDLSRMLKLDPQMSEQVMSLLGDRAGAMAGDPFQFMTDGKMDEAAIKELQAKTEATRAEYDTKLKAVLGGEKFQQLQEYEKSLGDRMMMTQFDQSFAASGSPLQPTQRDALMQIMSEERKKSPAPIFDQTGQDAVKNFAAMKDEAAIDRWLAQEAEYQQRVLAKAPQALNPDQVNALQQAFQQSAELQKFGMKMGREMMKQSGGKEGAVPVPITERAAPPPAR